MKRIITLTALLFAIGISAAQVTLDLSSDKQVELKNNAVLKDKLLKFTGSRSFAIVNNTKELDFSKGGTMMMVVRVTDFNKDPNKFRFFAQKPGSFLFGITNNKYNFSLCNDGKWSIALIGGMPPADSDFVHLAAVARRVDDPEQGKFGFYMDVYLNGERVMTKFDSVRSYKADRRSDMTINTPTRNTHFAGEVAEFSFTTEVLTPNLIAAAAKRSKLVKIKNTPGTVSVSFELKNQLRALQDKFSSGMGGFTARALFNAASTGAPEAKVLNAVKVMNKLGKNFSAEKFNAAQKDFAMLVNPKCSALLILGDCGSAFPVVDIYDPAIDSGICGLRSNRWMFRYDMAGRRSLQLNDYSPGMRINSELTKSGNGKYEFKVTWEHQILRAESNGTLSERGVEMDLSAKVSDAKIRLFDCSFPHWTLKKKTGKDFLVTPRFSGLLIPDPINSYNYACDYPRAENTMQFQAYYGDRRDGVYVAVEDAEGTFRHSGVFGKSDELNLYWQTNVPFVPAGQISNFNLNCKTRVMPYHGKWFEAGQVYKQFVSEKAVWWIKDLPRQSTPQWFRDNAIWILAGVFPSRNEATMIYLRDYFEQTFGVHLVGTTKRRMWPHFDQTTDIGKIRLANLQKAGLKVVPYCDPRLYSKDQPDGTKKWKPEQINWAIKTERGMPFIENYGVPCLILCPHNPAWQKDYLRICTGIIRNGFDGIYHDQLPCGHAVSCFSTEHGHLPNDPSFWIKTGYDAMYKKINEHLDREYPGKVHTGEDGSEPYLQMIDGFTVWRWIQENQIPLFQSVYSGRIQFTGKVYNHQCPGDWESNFAKAASQAVNGEQLGWITLEDLEAATPFRKYFKTLSFVRKALLEYFNCGQMTAPLEFVRAPKIVTLNWGNSSKHRDAFKVANPVIEHSTWQLADGRRMVLFLNTSDEVQCAEAQVPYQTKYIYVCRQDNAKASAVKAAPALKIAPYGVEVWLFSDTDNRAEADKIAAELYRTSKFDEGKTLSIKAQVNQKVPAELKVVPGKPVLIPDAAKYTNTFLRYFANGTDKDKVLIVYENSTLFYKGMVFPANTRSISLLVAYDASEKGGRFDIFADGKKVGSALCSNPGKYMGFQKLPVVLDQELSGKHDLEIRFHGKSCRIKGFVL